MEYYPSANCEIQTGKNTDRYELASEETAITGDGDGPVSYTWEWFDFTPLSPTPDGYTYAPTESLAPTHEPTLAPTPTFEPTQSPTEIPTEVPVATPVAIPVAIPVATPVSSPVAGIPVLTYHPSVPPPVK